MNGFNNVMQEKCDGKRDKKKKKRIKIVKLSFISRSISHMNNDK